MISFSVTCTHKFKYLATVPTFIKGMVEPPKNIRVNKIIISVVDSNTVLVSTSNSMCRLSAKAMAPRRPGTDQNGK